MKPAPHAIEISTARADDFERDVSPLLGAYRLRVQVRGPPGLASSTQGVPASERQHGQLRPGGGRGRAGGSRSSGRQQSVGRAHDGGPRCRVAGLSPRCLDGRCARLRRRAGLRRAGRVQTLALPLASSDALDEQRKDLGLRAGLQLEVVDTPQHVHGIHHVGGAAAAAVELGCKEKAL